MKEEIIIEEEEEEEVKEVGSDPEIRGTIEVSHKSYNVQEQEVRDGSEQTVCDQMLADIEFRPRISFIHSLENISGMNANFSFYHLRQSSFDKINLVVS